MNKKDLIALGVSEEIAEQIVVLHGKDIETHKTKLVTAQTDTETLKTQLEAANVAIESFKKLDVAGIQKAADEWKAKAEQTAADAVAQTEKMKFDYALDAALAEAKAKNAKAVRALLEADKLKLSEDGSAIDGLEPQLEKIKSENDYLFDQEKETPKIVLGGNNQPVLGDTVINAARKAAGLPAG